MAVGGLRAVKAHDVRRLRPCAICGHLGLPEASEEGLVDLLRAGECLVHARCLFRAEGASALFALPAEERGKVRVNDVPRGVFVELAARADREGYRG